MRPRPRPRHRRRPRPPRRPRPRPRPRPRATTASGSPRRSPPRSRRQVRGRPEASEVRGARPEASDARGARAETARPPDPEDRRLTIAGVEQGVLALVFAAVGVAWGLVSDRIGARWPAHDDGSIRRVDWRTAVTPIVGGIAMYALPGRFSDPVHLALFGGYFLALILLLATDLDQRLLPDVITLPLIPITAVALVSGINPLVIGAARAGASPRPSRSRGCCTCCRSRSGRARSGWAISSCSSASGCWSASPAP